MTESRFMDSLLIRNFKCFSDLELHFGRLTLLCGRNGAGKSTSYQPILLLAQAMHDVFSDSESNGRRDTEKGIGRNWPLNGELIRLGSTGDVLNHNCDSSKIEFCFGMADGPEIPVILSAEKGKSHLRRRSKISHLYPLNFNSRLNFISVDRMVSSVYPMPDRYFDPNFGVGKDGRYSCYFYYENLRKNKSFRKKLDHWLEFIAPGAKVLVQELPDESLFALKFKLSNTTEFMSPVNVGYGITYAFSIIVALLTSAKGDFIVIDSPEAHLHPRSQSRMGMMLANIAAKGVQIVVETHSDHILNGIRLAVKEEKLKPKDFSILFFSDVEDETKRVSRPLIDGNGSLSEWPEGFFDQSLIDNIQLTGVT